MELHSSPFHLKCRKHTKISLILMINRTRLCRNQGINSLIRRIERLRDLAGIKAASALSMATCTNSLITLKCRKLLKLQKIFRSKVALPKPCSKLAKTWERWSTVSQASLLYWIMNSSAPKRRRPSHSRSAWSTGNTWMYSALTIPTSRIQPLMP